MVCVAIALESRVHCNDSGVVDHAPHCKGCNTVQASGRTEISVPCAVRLNAASRLQMAWQVSAMHMPTLDCSCNVRAKHHPQAGLSKVLAGGKAKVARSSRPF